MKNSSLDTAGKIPPAGKTPRPYQLNVITGLRAAAMAHRKVLLQLPTGAGKTYVASSVAKGAAAKNKRVIFMVHRVELLEQTSQTFTDEGIRHGVIRAGEATPDEPVLIAMIQTLSRRLDKVSAPDLVFADEAHHAVSPTWSKVIASWPDAFLIGLTATPERLDGRGLGDCFDGMLQGPTTAELIASGYLSQYRAFAPSTVDLSSVRTVAGDFDRGEMANAMDRPSITGDIVRHYQRLSPGKQAIVFCASRDHSRNIAEAFRAAGIVAAHVDGETPGDQRAAAVSGFAEGRIQVLSNVELFGEGFDVPGAEVVILARPTQSLALHLQQIGRVLRPSPGKDHALILDHVGNISRHGLPDDPREWSLDSVTRKKRAEALPAVRQCPKCYCCHRPAAICPECGFVYPPNQRELEQRAGRLQELEKTRPHEWAPGIDIATAHGRNWFKLLDKAGKNEHRLRQIATIRGFKRGWVQHQMRNANGGAAP